MIVSVTLFTFEGYNSYPFTPKSHIIAIS